jgi:hypothetical protein
MPLDKFSEIEVMLASEVESVESRINSFDGSMEELSRLHGSLRLSAQDFAQTNDYVEDMIAKFASTPSSEPYSSYNRAVDIDILSDHFFSNYPEYQDYTNLLSENQQTFSSLQRAVKIKGLTAERDKLISQVRSSECPQVTRIGMSSGEMNMPMGIQRTGERPKTDMLYDLVNFLVLQSARGGVLLKPDYRYASRGQSIFMQTSADYADGFTFDYGDQLVCFTGKTKQ